MSVSHSADCWMFESLCFWENSEHYNWPHPSFNGHTSRKEVMGGGQSISQKPNCYEHNSHWTWHFIDGEFSYPRSIFDIYGHSQLILVLKYLIPAHYELLQPH